MEEFVEKPIKFTKGDTVKFRGDIPDDMWNRLFASVFSKKSEYVVFAIEKNEEGATILYIGPQEFDKEHINNFTPDKLFTQEYKNVLPVSEKWLMNTTFR